MGCPRSKPSGFSLSTAKPSLRPSKVSPDRTQALYVRTTKQNEQEAQTRSATPPGGFRQGSAAVLPTTPIRSGRDRIGSQNCEQVEIRVDSGDAARGGTPKPGIASMSTFDKVSGQYQQKALVQQAAAEKLIALLNIGEISDLV